MAIRKWKRKPTKKWRKKKWNKKRRIPRSLPLNGFPTKVLVKHKYATTIGLDPGTGTIATYSFRTNSMYDPDRTGIGHQPRGYDQYALNYNHYTVVGSKIKVTPMGPLNRNAPSDPLSCFGITIQSDDTFPYSDYTDLCESRFAGAGKMVPYQNDKKVSAYKRFSTKKYFACKSIVGNVPYRGNSTGDPSTMEQAYYVVWQTSPVAADIEITDFLVELEYLAVWSEPKYLAES